MSKKLIGAARLLFGNGWVWLAAIKQYVIVEKRADEGIFSFFFYSCFSLNLRHMVMTHVSCELQTKLSNTRVSPLGVYGINKKFTVPYTESRLFTYDGPFEPLLEYVHFLTKRHTRGIFWMVVLIILQVECWYKIILGLSLFPGSQKCQF